MHDNPIPGQTDDAQDRRTEAAVLSRVIELNPAHLTGRELSLDLVDDTPATMDVYAQLEQRVDRSHGESFDRLVRTARERTAAAALDQAGGREAALEATLGAAPRYHSAAAAG
jgi:hypothetical protein